MTVEEVAQWFKTNCSDRNGRPHKAGSDNAEDATNYDALSEEQKTALVDVVSGITISLQDAHGDILGTITRAYENRKPLIIGQSIRLLEKGCCRSEEKNLQQPLFYEAHG
ncbi:MAG: hypothetical protein RSD95_12985 [Clostridia bacterium]